MSLDSKFMPTEWENDTRNSGVRETRVNSRRLTVTQTSNFACDRGRERFKSGSPLPGCTTFGERQQVALFHQSIREVCVAQ
jgi:hypothetical protein